VYCKNPVSVKKPQDVCNPADICQVRSSFPNLNLHREQKLMAQLDAAVNYWNSSLEKVSIKWFCFKQVCVYLIINMQQVTSVLQCLIPLFNRVCVLRITLPVQSLQPVVCIYLILHFFILCGDTILLLLKLSKFVVHLQEKCLWMTCCCKVGILDYLKILVCHLACYNIHTFI